MKFVSFILFFLLLHIETLGDSTFLRFLPIVLILSLFPKYFSWKRLLNYFKSNRIVVYLFVLLSIGIFRSNYYKNEKEFSTVILKVLFFVSFVAIIICIAEYQLKKQNFDPYKSLYQILLLPAVLYFAINLIFYFFGINFKQSGLVEDNIDAAVLLGNFGVHMNRVRFPFASSFNNYSFNISLILLVSLFFIFVTKKRNIFLFLAAFLCLAKLLMTDTRMALILPFALLLLAVFAQNGFSKYAKTFFFFLFLLGPLLYIYVVPFLNDLIGLDAISRGDSDVKTGNSRLAIWAISLVFFSNFQFMQVFGYGEYGHFGSHQSLKWSADFVNYNNADFNATSHNSFFTVMYDYGYLGLIFYIIFFSRLFSLAKFETKLNTKYNLLIKMILVFIAWAGTTESLLGFYFENFMFMFLTVIIVLTSQFSIPKQKAALTQTARFQPAIN